MKRLLIMLLTAAMAMAAYPAFAAVNSTPHDFLAGTYGRCGTCHVPHAALGGARLWRTNINPVNDASWANSTVGALCGYCHNGGAGGAINNVNAENAAAFNNSGNVFAGTSHGRNMARLTGAPLNHNPGAANGKPYMTAATQPEAGYMECTSCHNPHYVGAWDGAVNTNNVNRPFLRPGATGAGTISGFCNDCHDDRYTTAIASTTNHPVVIAYNPTIALDPRKFIAAAAAMNTAVAVNHWSLGGKFEGNILAVQAADTSALVGCQSCHSIHQSADPTTPPSRLLALSYTNSAICEGCHAGRGNAGASVGTNGGDHPYDAALVGVMVMDGALWTTTEKGATGGAICTSCHKAHITTGNGVSYIRRAGAATWCTSCHSSVSPAAHHSNQTQLPTSGINCNNCHTGTGATAHNGFGYVFSIVGGCEACHTATDPINVGLANIPNAHLTAKQGAGAAVSHYMGTFTNTPALGINVKTGRWSTDAIRGARISAYLKDAAGNPITSDKSCYNATSGASAVTVIRCESCHSVLGNIGANSGVISASSGWMNNLLLQDYRDDSKNEATARSINSDFCIGCHNQLGNDAVRKLGNVDGVVGNSLEKEKTTVPPGMHPMTQWDITRALDAGYVAGGTARLVTGNTTRPTYADAAGAPAEAGGVGTNGVSYPGTNVMDCDSCHRPHLGNFNWNATNITAGHANPVPVILEDSGATDYANLCQDCHAY